LLFRSSKIPIILLIIVLSLGIEAANAQTTWIRNPSNPVLSPYRTGWDSSEVLIPRLYYDGSKYQMWYSGDNGTIEAGGGSIGYATSNDGVSWSKNSNPVLTPGQAGSWDSLLVYAGFVLKNASTYLMWYEGARLRPDGYCCKFGIGLATSADGLSWTKYAGNPVLTSESSSRPYISYPWVLMMGKQFKMWYACGVYAPYLTAICLASSSDGIHWSQNAVPVFRGTGMTTDWDQGTVYSPNVIYDGKTYGMWYSSVNSAGMKYQIGYATSPDGITWTRASGNPILGPSSSGAWDSYDSVDNQGILQVGGSLMLYYSADQLDTNGKFVSYKIGLAQSPPGFVISKFVGFGYTLSRRTTVQTTPSPPIHIRANQTGVTSIP
jgi:predicted GH43/DUF377 family glycosyl hydrolase